jgi:hypothetical protein
MDAGSKTNDLERLARDIGFHPVNQTHPAKLARQIDLSPVGSVFRIKAMRVFPNQNGL